jgi:hypothetical protein
MTREHDADGGARHLMPLSTMLVLLLEVSSQKADIPRAMTEEVGEVGPPRPLHQQRNPNTQADVWHLSLQRARGNVKICLPIRQGCLIIAQQQSRWREMRGAKYVHMQIHCTRAGSRAKELSGREETSSPCYVARREQCRLA